MAVVAALLVLSSLLPSTPSGAAELLAQDARFDAAREEFGGSPLVEEVTVSGVRSLPPGEARDALATEATSCRNLLFQPICWVTDAGFFQDRERLDWDELPRDELRLLVFHWIRGFRRASADARVLAANDGVEVRFEVDEGPPTLVSSLDVVQDTVLLSTSEIERAGFPPVGEPLNMYELREAEQRVREMLFERGYANALVEDSIVPASDAPRAGSDGDADRVDMRVSVHPGSPVFVDGIEVVGFDRVSERTILRSLGLQEGSLFRERDLEEARRRLYRSSLFRQSLVTTLEDSPEIAEAFAQVQAEDTTQVDAGVPGGDDPSVPRASPGDTTRTIVVLVQEAPFDDVSVGLGVTTLEFIQAQGSYSRHNLFGGARRLDLNATVGNLFAATLYDRGLFQDAIPEGVLGDVESEFLDPTWRFSVDFTQPWVGSPLNSLGIGAFARRRAVPGVVVEQSFGGNLTFSRDLDVSWTAAANYRYERTLTEASGVYFCVNFGICAPSTIDALQRSHQLSPFSLSLTGRRVDDPVNPSEGFSAELRAEHASSATISDYRYNSATAEAALYRRLGPGVVALRMRAGWVRPIEGTAAALGVAGEDISILHPRIRLYAGGARSVRGYGENQLGPRILTVPASRLTETESRDFKPCTEASVADGTCDPAGLDSDAFQPRPLGGNQLLEATAEYRIPINDTFGAAVFLDAGYVGDLNLNIPTGARAALTPGAGVRYLSPVGMIRVDLGIRPTLVETLPVVTAVGDGEDRRLVRLERQHSYSPIGEDGRWYDEIIQRLVLHLSIGGAL